MSSFSTFISDYGTDIGVARIFSGCTFSSKKLFLITTLKTQAKGTKLTKLTAPTLHINPAHHKCALKFDFLLCLGVLLPALGVHLQLYRINYASNFFCSGGCTALAMPIGTDSAEITEVIKL